MTKDVKPHWTDYLVSLQAVRQVAHLGTLLGARDSPVPHSYYYRGHLVGLRIPVAYCYVAYRVVVVLRGSVPTLDVDGLIPEALGVRPLCVHELGGHNLD